MAYADDMVLLIEEEGMRSMMERVKGYLDRKGMELNAGETKTMRFRKGGGRMDKWNWKWKGKVIEEVKEYKYLGYVLQRNGKQKASKR